MKNWDCDHHHWGLIVIIDRSLGGRKWWWTKCLTIPRLSPPPFKKILPSCLLLRDRWLDHRGDFPRPILLPWIGDHNMFSLYFDPASVPCWQLGGRGGRFQRAQGDIFCEESLKNFHFDWRCTSLQRGRITACSSTTISDGWCPTATTCSRQACETFFSLFFLLEHEVG